MRTLKACVTALTFALLAAAGNPAVASESKTSPFMATKGKTAQPIGHHEFCKRNESECMVHSRGNQRVKLDAERWNALVEINTTVNTMIKPVTDEDLFGKPEVWVYPTTSGDCEDFVLLKQKILVEQGWPLGALLITVVRQPNGDGHAVLTVLTDRGDLVLDNLDPRVTLWNGTPYHFLKRQSVYDSGRWVAIDDGRTVQVGSLQN